jgi:hypothetical protein
MPWLFAPLAAPATSAQVGACDVQLSATQVDYGRLSRATLALSTDGLLELPVRTVGLQVRCTELRDMSVFFRGVPVDGKGFRLTEKGHFTLRLRDGRLDGAPVELAQVDRGAGAPGPISASVPWLPDQGLAPVKKGQIAMGREFSARLEILAHVDPRALIVNDVVRWTTTGSIELAKTGSSREISLQAEVQPGRCNVEVIRHVSFGHIRSTSLDRHGDSTHVPAIRGGQLQVLCDGPMPFVFRVMRDERTGTAVAPVGVDATYRDAQLFGLGKTAAGESIGAYVLRWGESAVSDQGSLHVTRSVDGGRSWVPANGTVIADHVSAERVGYNFPQDAAMGPLATRTLDITLDASIYIAPRHTLSLDEEIAADGAMTFEIIY